MKQLVIFISAVMVLAGVVVGWIWAHRVPAPTISVIMPTYNRAATMLPRAITSIVKQTYTDFEFIIIDDGSTDDTAQIVKKFAAQDKRIRFFQNGQNRGIVYTLNRGLDLVRGKYIARIDDDDAALPKRFEKQIDFMEKNPQVAVVSSRVSDINTRGFIPLNHFMETDAWRIKIVPYFGMPAIAHPAVLMRRDFLQKNNIKYRADYKYLDDRTLWVDIMDAGGVIVNLPEVLTRIRIHRKNPEEYYITQKVSARRHSADLAARFSTDPAFLQLSPEERVPIMIEINKTKKLFPQDKFEEAAAYFLERVRQKKEAIERMKAMGIWGGE